MGGMEGMRLAVNSPGRIDRLILSNTSCHHPDPSFWNERIAAIRKSGSSCQKRADRDSPLPVPTGFARGIPRGESRRNYLPKNTAEESIIDSASVSKRRSIEHVARGTRGARTP